MDSKWYKNISKSAQDFISQLLEKEPSKRITAKAALEHPWLMQHAHMDIHAKEALDMELSSRLQAYQRLQRLRANILAVMISVDDYSDPNRAVNVTAQVAVQSNMDVYRETFDLLDKDKSGSICEAELSTLLNSLGTRLRKKEVHDLFTSVDLDQNGKLDFMEFVAMMQNRLFQRYRFIKN